MTPPDGKSSSPLLHAHRHEIAGTSTGVTRSHPRPDVLDRYDAALRASPGTQLAGTPLDRTPTRNVSLPFRRGGFTSLCAALDYAARGETGLNFFDARGRLLDVLPYSRLQAEAQAFARGLTGAGIPRGARLMLVAATTAEFCIAFFGAQYAGIVPVPVSTPVGLGAKAAYIEQLARQIAASDAAGLLVPAELLEFARKAAAETNIPFVGALNHFNDARVAALALRPLQADEACYVQFSSGSTREPRGVDIRQDRLMANIDGSLAAQQVDGDDAGVSWLPLYHDMGLIGFVLAPMCAQRSVDLMSPHDFARRPMQWLSLISERRATITYSPSFGYDLVVRRARTQSGGDLDLSCLRLAGIGADMIQPTILSRFADAFAGNGFDRHAFLPSYGMAEVCVGLTFSQPFTGIELDRFTDPQTGRARDFVVCGRVLPGHEIEIRDASGEGLGPRRIGRLFARGPSVMPGYFRQPANDTGPLHDGWLDTGDLGYWRGDELVITGRAKDLIIANGRNIWPQDIEWAVEKLPGVRRGDCCAFAVEHGEGESIVVLVEGRPATAADREALEGEVRQAVKEAVGVDGQVVLVGRQPGLPRTSSGKLSRAKARELFVAGRYGTV